VRDHRGPASSRLGGGEPIGRRVAVAERVKPGGLVWRSGLASVRLLHRRGLTRRDV